MSELAKVKEQANSEVFGRRRTGRLLLSLIYFFSKRKYSCYTELGVKRWGRRRIDFIAINLRQEIIGVEVKQSIQDLRNDNKWEDYLDYCHKFYFCIPEDLWDKYQNEVKSLVPKGIGLAVLLKNTGRISIIIPARKHDISAQNFLEVITRMVWRGGISARTTKSYKVKI